MRLCAFAVLAALGLHATAAAQSADTLDRYCAIDWFGVVESVSGFPTGPNWFNTFGDMAGGDGIYQFTELELIDGLGNPDPSATRYSSIVNDRTSDFIPSDSNGFGLPVTFEPTWSVIDSPAGVGPDRIVGEFGWSYYNFFSSVSVDVVLMIELLDEQGTSLVGGRVPAGWAAEQFETRRFTLTYTFEAFDPFTFESDSGTRTSTGTIHSLNTFIIPAPASLAGTLILATISRRRRSCASAA